MPDNTLQEQPIYSDLGDDERLCDLVEMFVDEMPQRIGQLTTAFDAEDSQEIGRLAHQMKGSVGSYGFHQLTPYAARLERAVIDGEPRQTIQEILSELSDVCTRVRTGVPE